MLHRIIPSSGELLPVIGLGSWIQFDIASLSPEKPQLLEVLRLMQEAGAKVIDSSPMYGRSEEMIGELSRQTERADDFFYATKVWTTGREAGIRQMKESMQKMQRPVMDLFQVHNLVDWKVHLATLRKWKEEGKLRYTGITHYQTSAHPELERIIQTEQLDFVQFNYSLLTRNAEKRLLPLCADRGVAVLINEPLEKGRLFQLIANTPLPPWAIEAGIESWAGFFIQFILSHPAVTCVIPGTSVPLHMRQLLEAGKKTPLTAPIRLQMAAFFNDR